MIKDKKEFIEQYTALIAGLNRDHQSLLWWATDISSKNRYTCLLPDYVQELMDTRSVVRRGRIDVCIQRYKKICAVFWFALLMYLRSVLARWVLGKHIEKHLSGNENFYVIKTFSYDSSLDKEGKYHDAFFGRLPGEFSTHKKVLLFVNVLGNFRLFLSKARAAGPFPIVPLEFFLGWRDICDAVAGILKFRVDLKQPVLFNGQDVTALVKYELYRTFNGIQINQLLHYHCTRRLLEKCQAETFLMTYENNPWERMCTLALREYSPGTKVIGYQHSVVPQAALNMLIHPSERDIVPLPDRILTVGDITAKFLDQYGHYPPSLVQAACALRYEYLKREKADRAPWRGHILVVLDGVKKSEQLLRYILSQLKTHQEYQIIVRAHPSLPWPYFRRQFGQAMDRLAHMQSSQQSLRKDLDWADVVIYWQSTVALEALSLGKPLVNFSPDSILSFDPLSGHSFLKWIVRPGESLVTTLEKIHGLSADTFETLYREAQDFIGQYFYPVTQERLRAFEGCSYSESVL